METRTGNKSNNLNIWVAHYQKMKMYKRNKTEKYNGQRRFSIKEESSTGCLNLEFKKSLFYIE